MDAAGRARYDRHLRLPGFGAAGQARLRAARVLVVGVGGLGCPAAQSLAAAGVGRLTLWDGDVVALENLPRQTLYGTADVGRPKVEAAAERLRALNPDVDVVPVRAWLDEAAAGPTVAGHDLALDCTDNLAARRALGDACQAAGVPLVHGALHRTDGQVALFEPGGPCHRCLFPAPPAPESCDAAGVLGPLASLVGTQMALEAVKRLVGLGEPLAGRLLLVDGLASRVEEVRFARRPDCPGCGGAAPARAAAAEGARAGEAAGEAAEEVDAATFLRLRAAGAVVLDVRTPEEAARRPVPGSLAVPADDVAAWTPRLPPGPVVAVCAQGWRSLRAARLLRRAGRAAHSLRGGLDSLDPDALAAAPAGPAGVPAGARRAAAPGPGRDR